MAIKLNSKDCFELLSRIADARDAIDEALKIIRNAAIDLDKVSNLLERGEYDD